jgi:hypothetical protein
MADRTRKFKSSVFSNIERTDAGLRFILEDFTEPLGSDKYRFENIPSYFYESGTGLFCTQITNDKKLHSYRWKRIFGESKRNR